MQLVQISKEQMTSDFLENLHQNVFDHRLPASYFRYDTCLAVKNGSEDLVSYALVREVSSDTVELAWGGTVPELRGAASVKTLTMFVDECLKHFENVTYQTWNKNHKMLKLGLGIGFNVVGCRQAVNGDIFLILNKGRE